MIGTIKSFPYTAVLYVGDQCAGVTNWSTDACLALYSELVDQRCDEKYPNIPADKYQCKFTLFGENPFEEEDIDN